MNNLRNKVQLIGNLGSNPEILTFENGTTKANFTLATKDVRKNDKGKFTTETQWHKIVAWGKTAEIAEQILNKGSEVAIEGKLTSRSYEDKEGNKRLINEIVAYEFLLIKSNKSDDNDK